MLRQPRGSVLVFAIVVLAIMAMLGTMYLVTVRQGGKIAGNAVVHTQANLVMDAATQHALGSLRDAFTKNVIATDSQVFWFNHPDLTYDDDFGYHYHAYTNRLQLKLKDAPLVMKGAPLVSPLNQFMDLYETEDYAMSSSFDLTSSEEAAADPTLGFTGRFSAVPLIFSKEDDLFGELKGQARRFDLRTSPTALTPSGRLPGIKEKPATQTVQGHYHIWISDLDAKLNAHPATWGIRPPGGEDPKTVEAEILTALNFTPDDITAIQTVPAKPYSAIGDLAATMPVADSVDYVQKRGNLQYCLTVNADSDLRAKRHPAALNINVAPVEIIAAALSRIPIYNKDAAASAEHMKKFAENIVHARPFLCRMDFEDFIASHLEGTPGDLNSHLGAIREAIRFRTLDGVGPAPEYDDDTIPDPSYDSELILSAFLEIPGIDRETLPDEHPLKFVSTVPSMQLRFEYFLSRKKNDIKFSVADMNNIMNSVSSAVGDDAQLTLRGETGTIAIYSGNDGVLEVPLPIAPDSTANIIVPGADGTFQSVRIGDDEIVNDMPGVGKCIVPGPDRVLQTKADSQDVSKPVILTGPDGIAHTSLFGFSYYSHCSARDNMVDDNGNPKMKELAYKPTKALVDFYNSEKDTDDPLLVLSEEKIQSPKFSGKFVYYGDAATGFEPEDIFYYNYGMADLRRWSCVGDGVRSNYYDMFFNFNDKMALDYYDTDLNYSYDEPVIESLDPTDARVPIRTGINQPNDDIMIADPESPIDEGDIIVDSGRNGKIDTKPTLITGDDKKVEVIRLALDPDTIRPFENPETGDYFTLPLGDDVMVWAFTQDLYYIVPGEDGVLQTTATISVGDEKVEAIVNGYDNDTVETQLFEPGTIDDFYYDQAKICVGADKRSETTVWGPIRASTRDQDRAHPMGTNVDQLPAGFGDFSWSPPFAFRSRYYGVYILADGSQSSSTEPFTIVDAAETVDLLKVSGIEAPLPLGSEVDVGGVKCKVLDTPSVTITAGKAYVETIKLDKVVTAAAGSKATVKRSAERRVEMIYDAATDKVLSKRTYDSDKRDILSE